MKFVHVAAVAFWMAGLVILPFLSHRRDRDMPREEFDRLHRAVRFFYVGLVSPSAFIAVGSGIALIFLREPYAAWFSLKLLLVVALMLLHLLSGLLILNLFAAGRSYSVLRLVASVVLPLSVATAILAVVLAKPAIGLPWLEDILRPGALGEYGRSLIGEVI